jgi:hypothetical protein
LKTSIYHYFAIVVIALAGIIYIAANCYTRKNLEREVEALKSELAVCQNTVRIDSELRRINAERIRQVNTRLERINASDAKIRENLDSLGDTGALDAGVCDTALAAYDMLVCGTGSDAVPSP